MLNVKAVEGTSGKIYAAKLQLALYKAQGFLPEALVKRFGLNFEKNPPELRNYSETVCTIAIRNDNIVVDKLAIDEYSENLLYILEIAEYFKRLKLQHEYFYEAVGYLSLLLWGIIDQDALIDDWNKELSGQIEELRAKESWKIVLLPNFKDVDALDDCRSYRKFPFYTNGELLASRMKDPNYLFFGYDENKNIFLSQKDEIFRTLVKEAKNTGKITKSILAKNGLTFVAEIHTYKDETSLWDKGTKLFLDIYL